MIIDHLKRTITVETDELLTKNIPLKIEYIDQNKILFYIEIHQVENSELSLYEENSSDELNELNIVLKSIKPAFHYLSRFDIHDYRVIKKKE